MSSSFPEKPEPTAAQKITVEEKASPSVPQEAPQTSNLQWRQMGEQSSKFIKELTITSIEFFQAYRLPLIVIGAILLLFITLKIALTLINAINTIPLVKPTLELIGIGYTGWFVYRYLISGSKRSELFAEFERWKNYFVGQAERNS